MNSTKEIIDVIRKGDRVSHKFMQHVANKLELLESDNIHVRHIAHQREQKIFELEENAETLKAERDSGWGLVESAVRILDLGDYADFEIDIEQIGRDAERWQAIINSPYIRILGNAGIGDKEYQHFGMEIWSAHNYGDAVVPETEKARELISTYADTIRADDSKSVGEE